MPKEKGAGMNDVLNKAGTVVRGKVAPQRGERGQGTTEYAILVGVLVVIAIIAIVAFRGKVQELWTAIAEGINGL
jgi:Flp pilus assembly pilin Flp